MCYSSFLVVVNAVVAAAVLLSLSLCCARATNMLAAEANLFLMLAAAGMSHTLFGQRLLPVGTLYDPFIARGGCRS